MNGGENAPTAPKGREAMEQGDVHVPLISAGLACGSPALSITEKAGYRV